MSKKPQEAPKERAFDPRKIKLKTLTPLLDTFDKERVSGADFAIFKQVMAEASDMTPEEIDELTIGDLMAYMFRAKTTLGGEQTEAVPLPSATS